MILLAIQILVCLLISAVLGGVVGWFLRAAVTDERLAAIEMLQDRLHMAVDVVEDRNARLGQLRDELGSMELELVERGHDIEQLRMENERLRDTLEANRRIDAGQPTSWS